MTKQPGDAPRPPDPADSTSGPRHGPTPDATDDWFKPEPPEPKPRPKPKPEPSPTPAPEPPPPPEPTPTPEPSPEPVLTPEPNETASLTPPPEPAPSTEPEPVLTPEPIETAPLTPPPEPEPSTEPEPVLTPEPIEPVPLTPPPVPEPAGPPIQLGRPAGSTAAAIKALKIVLLILFGCGIVASGYVLVDHFLLTGDSPGAVVKRYYRAVEASQDVSGLLSAESRKLYEQVSGPHAENWVTAVARAYAKHSTWQVTSEQIDGDRAWVTVVFETDDPVKARIAALEAEIQIKNQYNRRTGDYDLIRSNNTYLELEKRKLAVPVYRRAAEALKRTEQRVFCVREGGRWKVAPTEQMDAVLEKVGEAVEEFLDALEENE